MRAWYTRVMTNSDTVMKYAMRPIICGLAGKLAGMAIGIDSSGGSLEFLNMSLSPSSVIGISVAGATVAAAATHDVVLSRVQSMGYAASTEKAIAPILSGLFTVAAVRLTVGEYTNVRSIMEVGALGALSEIGGTFLHDDIIMPAMSSSGGNAVMAMR